MSTRASLITDLFEAGLIDETSRVSLVTDPTSDLGGVLTPDPLAPKACRVSRVAAYNTSSGLVIPFDNEIRDDGNFWDEGESTRLTIPEDGWYTVGANSGHATANNQWFYLIIQLNGVSALAQEGSRDSVNNASYYSSPSTTRYFFADDYLELVVSRQANVSLFVGDEVTNFWIVQH